jgi:hypothetical protein
LKPVEIMTDTGAYTDAIFGIFYLLGFQSARGSLTPAACASGGSIPRPITAPDIGGLCRRLGFGLIARLAIVGLAVCATTWKAMPESFKAIAGLAAIVFVVRGAVRNYKKNAPPEKPLVREPAAIGWGEDTLHLMASGRWALYRPGRAPVEIASGQLFHVEVAGLKGLQPTRMEYNHTDRQYYSVDGYPLREGSRARRAAIGEQG